jgi:outer membrane lipoprotein-sorting protein
MIAVLGLLGLALAGDGPTIVELLDATDDIARGESSIAVVEMQVKTARYERHMKMKAWSRGTEKSLIRILEPAKEAGTSTLKLDDNIWNYLPKVDRTMKVPAGMMSSGWMGSHFSNDDLVKDSRMSEDYTSKFLERPEDGGTNYVIELVPNEDAAVVYGKLVVTITPDRLPVDIKFYDERENLARTMTYSDPKELGGKMVTTTMTLIPGDKPDEYTRITYAELDFDADVPDSTFTLQALRR